MDIERWEEGRLGVKEFKFFMFHQFLKEMISSSSKNIPKESVKILNLFTVTVEFTVKV